MIYFKHDRFTVRLDVGDCGCYLVSVSAAHEVFCVGVVEQVVVVDAGGKVAVRYVYGCVCEYESVKDHTSKGV